MKVQKTEFKVEVYLGDKLIPDEELHNLQFSCNLAHLFASDNFPQNPKAPATMNDHSLLPIKS